jgi:hypothetical protein
MIIPEGAPTKKQTLYLQTFAVTLTGRMQAYIQTRPMRFCRVKENLIIAQQLRRPSRQNGHRRSFPVADCVAHRSEPCPGAPKVASATATDSAPWIGHRHRPPANGPAAGAAIADEHSFKWRNSR